MTGSSWLEAANNIWKYSLANSTSLGGGHAKANTNPIYQVMRRACLWHDPRLTEHVLTPAVYKCGKCGVAPKHKHICLPELKGRADAAAKLTAATVIAGMPIAPFPNEVSVPAFSPVLSETQQSPPQSPVRSNQTQSSHRFELSPTSEALQIRLENAMLLNMGAMPAPTDDEMIVITKFVRKHMYLEQYCVVDGAGYLLKLLTDLRLNILKLPGSDSQAGPSTGSGHQGG